MNNTAEYTFNYQDIEVTNREIENMIGYPKSEIPEMVSQKINEIKKELGSFCSIRAGYKIFNDIQIRDNHFILGGKKFQSDKIIAGSLKRADSMAIFVCPLNAYIIDIIASLIVEKATDKLQGMIEELVLVNQKQITNRYSPGYCGWNVSEQQQLFALLPDNFCGVRLNKAALMNPIKSVSGIIGIGQDVRKTAYQCNKCDIKDCLLANKQ